MPSSGSSPHSPLGKAYQIHYEGRCPSILLTIGFQAMIIGQIVAWRWEGIGSLLILGGFALFAIVNHGVPINVVYGPWLVTGLLYLICWWRTPKMVGG